jgi:hypothetical protein
LKFFKISRCCEGDSLISLLSRDMLSTNKTLEKWDFDYWYIIILFINSPFFSLINILWLYVKPAAYESNLLANRLAWQLAQKVSILSCADSFREDWTTRARGLQENIYRFRNFSPREEKISAYADVVSLVLSCLNQLANEKP